MVTEGIPSDSNDVSNKVNETSFIDLPNLSLEEYRKLVDDDVDNFDTERKEYFVPLSKVTERHVRNIAKMSFLEEIICVLLLGFGVPNGIFTIPPLVYVVGTFVVGDLKTTLLVLLVLLIPLAVLPQPFVPATHQSWLAFQVVRYFSFRFITEEAEVPTSRPQILVAPPHGVFPYGNILALLAYPTVTGGRIFRGLASSAALYPPIFKQLLRSIGIIDASRHVAMAALQRNESLGISTGGVAEVFETNEEDECILLHERKGLIKLALRTGADIVPCYLFGNTKLLGCWTGYGLPPTLRVRLERLSRKLGLALILIYGRFGLPIPRRLPILAVKGKAIPTHHMKCEEPTKEQVDALQAVLLKEMEDLFNRYKKLYGWEDKKLIIK